MRIEGQELRKLSPSTAQSLELLYLMGSQRRNEGKKRETERRREGGLKGVGEGGRKKGTRGRKENNKRGQRRAEDAITRQAVNRNIRKRD